MKRFEIGVGSKTNLGEVRCGKVIDIRVDHLGGSYIAKSDLSELQKVFGGNVGGVIPDPIPNSEVKPSGADGTAWVTAWESRSLPGLFLRPKAAA